jgi:energy-coupling factor transporter ATP-binding protein EcfA2
MAHPLRCHLLIGPPGSGKSTLAVVLREPVGLADARVGTALDRLGARGLLFTGAPLSGHHVH